MSRTFGVSARIVLALLVVFGFAVSGDSFRLVAPVESEILEFRDESVEMTFAFPREDGYYRRISFTLGNLSSEPITIDWNRSSITLPSGEVSNVLHEGMEYAAAGSYAAPTTVPPGIKAVDSFSPTSNVKHTSGDGWSLLPMRIRVGSEVGFYLAVTVDGVDRGYDFRFEATAITDPQPIAYFESGVTMPGTVRLVAAQSTDPEGAEASYAWDFGDGSGSALGRMQTHTYDSPGTYEVALLVTDSWGRTASFVRELSIDDSVAGEAPASLMRPTDLTWRKLAFFSLLAMIILAFVATEPIRWIWR